MSQTDSTEGPGAEREPPPLSVLCMSSCCTVTRVLVVCHRLTQLKVLELRENHLRSLFCVCLLAVL